MAQRKNSKDPQIAKHFPQGFNPKYNFIACIKFLNGTYGYFGNYTSYSTALKMTRWWSERHADRHLVSEYFVEPIF